MIPEELGRELLDLAQSHQIDTQHDGSWVVSGGNRIFGPASPADCESWICDMLGRHAIEALTKPMEIRH